MHESRSRAGEFDAFPLAWSIDCALRESEGSKNPPRCVRDRKAPRQVTLEERIDLLRYNCAKFFSRKKKTRRTDDRDSFDYYRHRRSNCLYIVTVICNGYYLQVRAECTLDTYIWILIINFYITYYYRYLLVCGDCAVECLQNSSA